MTALLTTWAYKPELNEALTTAAKEGRILLSNSYRNGVSMVSRERVYEQTSRLQCNHYPRNRLKCGHSNTRERIYLGI